ncbi:CPBP family intramembrane glutamic endopeptidase [Enterococcus xiangfangensis]|uniref:Type II CAAX endopeptidase family protein n=1 Tax=Enterococcus xiangfangensis TaxID=1296537 RepID=A0ABU3F673_9ENTE|nr:type II CAAX endopeptidase family protein [Enterococcus xiangfangensis]MDT2758169.1 type II CAAX endopeptidase family protein [Enterococcus xiangfangensis]
MLGVIKKSLLFVVLYLIITLPRRIISFSQKSGIDWSVSTIIFTILVLFICIFLCLRLTRNYRTKLDFTTLKPSEVFRAITFGFLGNFILQAIVLLFFNTSVITDNQVDINKLTNNIPFVLTFLLAIVVGPIGEELLLRGFLATQLLKINLFTSFTLTTILFSFGHFPTSLYEFLRYFVLGTILYLIFYRSKRLEYSIAAHMFINLIALLPIISAKFF